MLGVKLMSLSLAVNQSLLPESEAAVEAVVCKVGGGAEAVVEVAEEEEEEVVVAAAAVAVVVAVVVAKAAMPAVSNLAIMPKARAAA